MANRCAAFLARLLSRWLYVRLIIRLLLLVSRELVLAFEFEFKLDLLKLLRKPFIFFEKTTVSFFLSVDRAVKLPQVKLVLVSDQDQRRDSGTADVRTVPDVGTGIVFARIKLIGHREFCRDSRKLSAIQQIHLCQFPITPAPQGLNCYVLDSDQQVQNVVRIVFEKFAELGSAHAVLRYMAHEKILIGRREINGLYPDAISWHAPNRSTILHILQHPIYAGAYLLGRTERVTTSNADGQPKTVQRRLQRDDWDVLIRDKVPAYITWEHWEQNQQKLREDSTKFSFGASRGVTLITGRVICGKCGAGMTVHYRDGLPVTLRCRPRPKIWHIEAGWKVVIKQILPIFPKWGMKVKIAVNTS
jgi:hypothetical protein